MAGKDADLRRRNKKQKDKNGNNGDQPPTKDMTETPATTGTEQAEEESVWQTLSSHWVIRYLLPLYLVYTGLQGLDKDQVQWKPLQQWILQDAEWINSRLPFLHLRESVGHDDERQLLIVGTMGSGTRQVAASLKETLGLEIGHELSDSQSYSVRDGTVSWMFGIRFLDPPTPGKLIAVCQQATYEVGFHPRMYRGGICSERDQWSRCWAKECVDILQKEWACALRRDGGCQFQPFRRTLHQTRNPRAVVESLVAKFCHGGAGQDAFVRIVSILFGNNNDTDFEQYSCLEVASHYVLEYNKAMIAAREKGVIHAMYKVEETTPCQVAELGGLGATDDVVYEPNRLKFHNTCHQTANSVGRQLMTPKKNHNKANKDRVRLEWADFEGGKHGSKRPTGDMSLVDDMKELMRTLGYDPEVPIEISKTS